ncbi:DUF5691 domain-containing protein [Fodinicola acaciae]|uniref:DUF5691 domain-containing protein n=1 Tax=Fodinicola acaciae TaxID=2681555 RepID=UPI0013D0E4CA|nr:DUF5691 domain-containing protein [Fodinicola acaciae]
MTTWDDVVAAATVGTARRRLDIAKLPPPVARSLREVADLHQPPDPPGTLLDAAAFMTAYRRAGKPLQSPVATPRPAPDDRLPTASALVSAALTDILAGGDTILLDELVTAMTAAGFRAPEARIPALLDRAAMHGDLAKPLVEVVGERGRWLAAQRPEWRKLLAYGEIAAPLPDDWRVADPLTRRDAFAAARRHDPGAAREALMAGWDTEALPERRDLLAAFAEGLSDADEDALNLAAADRRREVREIAWDLLRRLPDSGRSQRMAERARLLVTIEKRRLGRHRMLIATPGYDAGMRADGIAEKPGRQGEGLSAFWLRQVIAATPLRTWSEQLPPAELLAMTDNQPFGGELRTGWMEATQLEEELTWATAFVKALGPYRCQPLLALLPPDVRTNAVATALSHDGQRALTLLSSCARPWPPELSTAVLAALAEDPKSYVPRTTIELIGYRAVADESSVRIAELLRGLAERFSQSRAEPALRRAATLIDIRRHMLEGLR